ncbi:MAG: UDP-N-acetylglucosamine 2-epimerase (non-hydrolyzing), partial [Methanoregulaceae archaeon]|nr:UDP-N-acetylglucosamine 2-epimerase (non-hydrolyzing) [Methanoregulaceae archaeon]
TILGTRPEIIRLSQVIRRLDNLSDHCVVHTGQNYDPNLSDIFFREMGVREPDFVLGVRGDSFGEQIGRIIRSCEKVMREEQPDRLLLLGDTNSSLSAIVAKRLGIPVYHMEAGNRCYDDRVPEEVNRRIIDHCSDVLLPYTERSRMNLLREGIPGERILVTGNPILEVIEAFQEQIGKSGILQGTGLGKKKYILVTMHRAENVDIRKRVVSILQGVEKVAASFSLPVIISVHPHTKDRISQYGLSTDNPDIHFHSPFGFLDFISLEQNAFCVISDSGTVQEECCIFRVPNVTIRDVTERPETLECGSNILSGADPEMILRSARMVTDDQGKNWTIPEEYLRKNVSSTITKIILGHDFTRTYSS